MTDPTNPASIAANMLATRGYDQAKDRCERYVAGKIRSENSKEFWASVLIEIEKQR